MRPISIAEEIKASYKRYMRTTFPIADESLRCAMHALLEQEGMLWRGPYLSLQRPYVQMPGMLAERAGGLGLHSAVMSAGAGSGGGGTPFGAWRLYAHQQEAIEHILAGRNTIVSSGTGSGKTEAFLLPILDHCLRHPGPGIRALILYPMNALANDQYERFARFLAGTGVTFARYTGDTPESEEAAAKQGKERRPETLCREAIWYREEIRRPQTHPNILMTNYAMLEFLLLRKEDRQLFDESLRFLVLDEVHTYGGARGVEVACLIRRLKEHTEKLDGGLHCIGTSATVRGRDKEAVASFATELFGEPFSGEHVVTETYEPPVIREDLYLPPAAEIEPADLRHLHGLEDPAAIASFCRAHVAPGWPVGGLDAADIAEFLGALLSRNALFREIERILAEPCSLDEVTRCLRTGLEPAAQRGGESEPPADARTLRPGTDEAYLRREVEAYLLLGARARLNGQPLIRPKVHMFWRGLQGFSRCSRPGCGRLQAELIDRCPECNARCLPLEVCRSCGQDFYRGYAEDRAHEPALEAFSGGRTRKKREALPPSIRLIEESLGEQVPIHLTHELRQPGAFEEEGEEPADPGHAREIDAGFCPECATVHLESRGACECGGVKAGSAELLRPRTYVGPLHQCPACRAVYGGGTEIVSQLRSATMVSINILIEGLFQNLTPEQRRLLVFCDNRQDTAFQSAHLNYKHAQYVGRQIIYEVLAGGARAR
ncbi:MAG: DEAD/DEAH box helicase, partial [Candidatus Eisenbacteria bacterium]|nr:DEAD/DEAH box helicase [Candidatus Eisenbacteria bacterium]